LITSKKLRAYYILGRREYLGASHIFMEGVLLSEYSLVQICVCLFIEKSATIRANLQSAYVENLRIIKIKIHHARAKKCLI
jgi:hypothetical protein